MPVTRIDLANFMAYANICEEAVTLAAGGTVQRYTCDLMVSTSDTHEAVITAITACMGSCQLTDTDGQYQLVGGYDDTAGPKIAYSADDMMGAYEWQPSPPSRERINIVRGRYCNPTKLYQLEDWPAVEVTGLYDGIPRVRTVELIGVTRAETAQRIAKQMLLRDQYPGRLSCAVGPRGFLVKVGSLVTLSLPTEGWNSKLFRVIDQTESHDLLFSMTLQEEAPEIYAWDEEEKPLPDDITPPGYDPADTRTPTALTATARTVAGGGGTVVPYIDVSWTPETSELVAGIEIQAKESAGSIWVPVTEGLFDASVGAFSTTANAPDTEIDIRARYRMMSGVYGAWVETSVTSAAAPVPVSNVDGLGWLATSSATGTLLLNAAYTSVAADAVATDAGEVVLCATGTDGNQAVATDYEYSWSGRRRRVQRHPGHDAASPTIHTQQAGKKGFIVHHHGGNGGAFLAPSGALVRNRLLQSESLSVSPWSASGATVSINADFDHYGVQGLDRIIEDSSTGNHFIGQSYTHATDPTGLSWTLSAVVKAGGRSKVQLCFPASGGVFAMETVCNFDLATGTRISNTANVTATGIIDLGGGLYRVWMTAPATGNAPIIARIFLLDDAGNRSYTGSGALLYAGHVQLEQASTFTVYQCTTTGPAQRTAFCYKVGAQWYYDRGDGTQVAFVPDSNYIALGWLATSSTDTISGGGLLSPVTLTEAAFPAADVTAENTAADTATVGGRASATIAATIAASGRLVSGAKVPQAIVAGAGTVLTASPLSASQSSGVATINVAAHTRYYDFGAVSYNAGAITGLSTSTVYYIYADDPDYAGGAVTYVATTSLTAAIATGRIYFGKLVTPSTGSGGTTVPPPEYCVDIAMWLGGALRAGDARRGDDLWCMDDGGRFIGRRAIESLEYAVADCVELRAGHARVVVSDTTPLWTTTRGLIRAGVARPGDRVAVRLSGIDAVLALDCVSRVGARPVALIRVGDHSYAAGVEPDAMIYTHNGAQKP